MFVFIPPGIRVVSMFVTVDSEAVFNTRFVCIYMVHLHNKFHMPNSNDSSIIAFKLKAKYRFTWPSFTYLLFIIVMMIP